ncbi:MAG: 30S ribosomal protein S20 [Rickettsiales bacterium]|nr:30S ribosomal protein S20 [Rickettsiales bacterium]
MANHTSAKKSIRQIAKRTMVNKQRVSQIRTYIKKLEAAIAQQDKQNIAELFKQTQSLIMKGVTKNLLKKNTASRKISRLSARVKKVA